MCLQVTSRPKRKSGVGWKLFTKGEVRGTLDGPFYGKGYRAGKWYEATRRPGFHIYVQKPYAISSWVNMRMVRYQDAVGEGKSNGG